jgi:hypothetical protein
VDRVLGAQGVPVSNPALHPASLRRAARFLGVRVPRERCVEDGAEPCASCCVMSDAAEDQASSGRARGWGADDAKTRMNIF